MKLSDEALSRAAGAFLIAGNRIKLLKDAGENYPAWIEAIESAGKWIHFETFIIHEDEMGRQFADLLATKAAEGVKVRLVYDWAGALGNASRRFFRRRRNPLRDPRFRSFFQLTRGRGSQRSLCTSPFFLAGLE